MSKTVTVPSNVNWLEIQINGKKYVYQGGTTVSVPDEVAALLEANAENEPKATQPELGQPEPAEGSGGILVVHDVDGTLDKTWQEIADADLAVVKTVGDGMTTVALLNEIGHYEGGTYFCGSYAAETASGYPVYDNGGGGIEVV